MNLQVADLTDYGLDSFFRSRFKPFAADGDGRQRTLGRVLLAAHGTCRVATAYGEVEAVVGGRLRHAAADAADLPVVGDWLVLEGDPAVDAALRVHGVLPRRSLLSRQAAGASTAQQPVAANVELVVLVMGLDGDFNLRRLERLLVLAHESGARPLVVLNKADLADDVETRRREVESVAVGVPVVVVSCLADDDVAAVERQIASGETIVLLGSSGVGKSTLLNRLLGVERMRTGAVREGDDRGRHTTTHRELVRLPGGGLLVDTPGLREIRLWASDEAFERTFDDVEAIAARCRFRDCRHDEEPGCAIAAALETGQLARDRLESYRKLERELRSAELRRDEAARRAAERATGKLYRKIQSARRGKKRS